MFRQLDILKHTNTIENNSVVPMQGLGGKTSNNYQYDELNRLIAANGYAKTKNFEGTYSLQMQYDNLYNIIAKDSTEYLYENPEHPNAVSQIDSKKYQYDANGNPILIEDSINYRRLIWDEENRLALLSDNGNGNNYVYDHSGERVIKRQTSLQNVYIDGMPVGMTANTKNATVYVSPNFVVKNHGFTKHYYAGSERVMSKIGIGEFNNHFSPTNQVITAGNKNYIQRLAQLNQGLNDYYLQLQFPPGNPTQPNLLGQPEQTGQPLPTIVGDYSIPRGWPQQPYFNPPGGPPGPPAQWGEPITNDNVTAGYGYLSNGLEERDLYFYHPDHLGSTSIITDRNGIATQFVAYLPFGESFVDEHSSSWESPYKFNGKEIDQETGLYYYGARYYDPKVGIWFGIDPLAEKYPNVGGMVYCASNPIKYIDPTGMTWDDPEQAEQLQKDIENKIGELNKDIDVLKNEIKQGGLSQEEIDNYNSKIEVRSDRVSELNSSKEDIKKLGNDENNVYVLSDKGQTQGNVTKTDDGKISINAGGTGLKLHEIKHISQSLNAGGLKFNKNTHNLQYYADGVDAQITAETQAYRAQASFTGRFDGKPQWAKNITPQMIGNMKDDNGNLLYPDIFNHFNK